MEDILSGTLPGEIRTVEGTPLDFHSQHTIGERIASSYEQIRLAGGYGHNWILDGQERIMWQAALVRDPAVGRKLTVTTSEPGIQSYSGNFLDGTFTGRHGSGT